MHSPPRLAASATKKSMPFGAKPAHTRHHWPCLILDGAASHTWPAEQRQANLVSVPRYSGERQTPPLARASSRMSAIETFRARATAIQSPLEHTYSQDRSYRIALSSLLSPIATNVHDRPHRANITSRTPLRSRPLPFLAIHTRYGRCQSVPRRYSLGSVPEYFVEGHRVTCTECLPGSRTWHCTCPDYDRRRVTYGEGLCEHLVLAISQEHGHGRTLGVPAPHSGNAVIESCLNNKLPSTRTFSSGRCTPASARSLWYQ